MKQKNPCFELLATTVLAVFVGWAFAQFISWWQNKRCLKPGGYMCPVIPGGNPTTRSKEGYCGGNNKPAVQVPQVRQMAQAVPLAQLNTNSDFAALCETECLQCPSGAGPCGPWIGAFAYPPKTRPSQTNCPCK